MWMPPFKILNTPLLEPKARSNDQSKEWTKANSTSVLIGGKIYDSSIVWKYVRPVDSVRAAVGHQVQDQ